MNAIDNYLTENHHNTIATDMHFSKYKYNNLEGRQNIGKTIINSHLKNLEDYFQNTHTYIRMMKEIDMKVPKGTGIKSLLNRSI